MAFLAVALCLSCLPMSASADEPSVASREGSEGPSASLGGENGASPYSIDDLLTYAGGDSSEGDEADAFDGASSEEGGFASEGDGSEADDPVTIVVQLEEEEVEPHGVLRFLGLETSLRDRVKASIGDAAADKGVSVSMPAASPAPSNGWNLFPQESRDDDLVEYTHAIQGFTMRAPARLVDAIKGIPGVRNAFVEREYRFDQTDSESSVTDAGEGGAALPTQSLPGGSAGPVQSIDNRAALAMSGIDSLPEKGDGMSIAVIDSGVDTSHAAFSGSMDGVSLAFTEQAVAHKRVDMVGGGRNAAFVSSKIPFSYDYADKDADATPANAGLSHGTHVAGIAAANAGEVRGTAPHAQLLVMKVARDLTGAIPETAILDALEDAAVLGPDVVNVSLGSNGGFSSESSSTFDDAFSTLRSQGCIVSASEGNSGSSAAHNSSGKGLSPVGSPDTGISSTPGSLAGPLSAASAENSVGKAYFTLSDGSEVAYVAGETMSDTVAKRLDAALSEGKHVYVDGGRGTSEDAARLKAETPGGFSDKVIVFQDGTTDNQGKILLTAGRVSNMADLRPAAIVVFSDAHADLTPLNVGAMSLVACVCVSDADGRKMLSASDKTLTYRAGAALPASTSYAVNDFSSWGPTPELSMKPEILAPGGNIYSSVLKGTYGYKSGTSMAAPYVAGVSASLEQYVASSPKFSSVGRADRDDVVMQLMMSTAKPVAYASTDAYYSPRQQGSGMVSASEARRTDVYLTAKGTEGSRPKAELGESPEGLWTFSFSLHNVGEGSRSFEVFAAALGERIAEGLFAQQPVNYAGRGIDVRFSGSAFDASSRTVSVPAGSSVELDVEVACAQEYRDAMASAVNGAFVDGFVFLKPVEADGVELSIPFMGFYGSWSKAPVFDGSIYEGTGAASGYATRLNMPGGTYPLGINPLDPDAFRKAAAGDLSVVNADKLVISNQIVSKKAAVPASPSAVVPSTGLLRGASKLDYAYCNASGEAVKRYGRSFVSKSAWVPSKGRFSAAEDDLRSGSATFNGIGDDGRQTADGKMTLRLTATTSGPNPASQTREFGFYYDTTPPVVSQYEVSGDAGSEVVSFKVTDATFVAGVDFHDPATGRYFHRMYATDAIETEDPAGGRTYRFEVSLADLRSAWEAAGLGSDKFRADAPLCAWDYGLNYSLKTPSQVQEGVVEKDGLLIREESNEVVGYAGTASVVSVPSGITSIAAGAFRGLPIEAVIIPATVRSIGADAFSSCSALASVSFEDDAAHPSQLTSVGDRAFAKVGEADVVLPRNVSSLGIEAFSGSSVQSVSIPSSLADVPTRAFADSSVKTVVLAEGVKSIGEEAFSGCANLRSVTRSSSGGTSAGLPDSVSSIGARAFLDAGIASLDLGRGLESIGTKAFSGSALTSLVVPDGVKSIGSDAFSAMPRLRSVELGRDVAAADLEGAFSGDGALKSISAAPDASEVSSRDGVLFSKDGKRLIAYPGGVAGTYAVPEGTRDIARSAFARCALSSVKFPESVVQVGDGAFAESSLSGQLELPAKLDSIGARAFEGTGLESVDLGGARTVGQRAFGSCTSLVSVDFRIDLNRLESVKDSAFNPNVPLRSVKLPDSTVEIGPAAFSNNSALASVHLGKGVSASFTEAFAGCGGIREISVSEGSPYYSAESGVLYRNEPDGMHLVASLAANGLREYVVKEGTVQIDRSAFKNNKQLQSLVLPEGLKVVEAGAFNGCSALREVSFPDSLEKVNGFLNTAIEVADFGSNIVEIKGNAFSGHNPKHLVVRGGNQGTFANSAESSAKVQPTDTAYFGEGMVSANFTYSRQAPPKILVVPSNMVDLKLYDPARFQGAADIAVYAPKGTSGWNAAAEALSKAGIDMGNARVAADHLKEYAPLSVSLERSGDAGASSVVPVRARAAGGVEGGYEYRFSVIASDGSLLVSGEWTTSPEYNWADPSDGSAIRCEVRDATMLTASASLDAHGSDPGEHDPIGPVAWQRKAGDDAMGTMSSIVEEGWKGQTGSTVVIATNAGYWDALTASGLAGLSDGPVLMTDPSSLSDETRSLLARLAPSKVYLAGGPAAVSESVAAEVRAVTGTTPVRLYGETATGTACAIFREGMSAYGSAWGSTAIIATNDGYWDALAAAPLSYHGHLPIMLTEGRSDISDETVSTLKENGIDRVLIAGGQAAVSPAVEAKLSAAGIAIEKRFAGETAVGTSLLVAEYAIAQGMTADRMGVATTGGYWDALTGAALCGRNGSVLALVNDDEAAQVSTFVGNHAGSMRTGYVFGGSAAVSDAVLALLKGSGRGA